MFIVIEGMDYAGKSHLVESLKEQLGLRYGKDVVTYGNPGGTEVGKEIRRLFKNANERSRLEDFFLLCANRISILHQVKKDLEEGKIVIVDRWDISAHVYQAIPDVGQLKDVVYYRMFPLYQRVHDLPIPDYCICLDVDFDIIQARAQQVRASTIGETDRYETDLKALHENYQNVMAATIVCSPKWAEEKAKWNDKEVQPTPTLYQGHYHPASPTKPCEKYIYLPVRNIDPFEDISPVLSEEVIRLMEENQPVNPSGKTDQFYNESEELALRANAQAVRDQLAKLGLPQP